MGIRYFITVNGVPMEKYYEKSKLGEAQKIFRQVRSSNNNSKVELVKRRVKDVNLNGLA